MPFKKFQIFFTLPQTPAPFCPSGTKTANPGMPVHSGGEASGTVAPDFGGWLPLGARENALEDRGHLFEPQASCVPCSPPLAVACRLRGTIPASRAPRPGSSPRTPAKTFYLIKIPVQPPAPSSLPSPAQTPVRHSPDHRPPQALSALP